MEGIKSPKMTRAEIDARSKAGQVVLTAEGTAKQSRWAKLMGKKSEVEASVINNISDGLKFLYNSKLKPLETAYRYQEYHHQAWADAEFSAKPMVLLLGQYSTGKTTFIQHILGEGYPGNRVGPEPTTDKFVYITHGKQSTITPGNLAVTDPTLPFKHLESFGSHFLQRFQVSKMANTVLEHISVVDSPGILSGEKQRVNRMYDFTDVLKWFADRADLIILLFDANKLDISDEYKRCLEAIAHNDEKIKIVLNKADAIPTQELMRVFGALMWSLAKVFNTPEVPRVYISSFWDKPFLNQENRNLFTLEKEDLCEDLMQLPKHCATRKLNDMLKRARKVVRHAYVICYCKKHFGGIGNKDKKRKQMVDKMQDVYDAIKRERDVRIEDYIPIATMRQVVSKFDFEVIDKPRPGLFEAVDAMLQKDIPQMLSQLPIDMKTSIVRGGVFDTNKDVFGIAAFEGFNAGTDEEGWIVDKYRAKYDADWNKLGIPSGGRLIGSVAKDYFTRTTKLTNADLSRMWALADQNKRGSLSRNEFALACYISDVRQKGHAFPTTLPPHLKPPADDTTEPPSPSTPTAAEIQPSSRFANATAAPSSSPASAASSGGPFVSAADDL